MSETVNQEGAPAGGDPPKKSKTKLIVILLVVFLLLGAGGGGGYYYFVVAANAADGEDHSEEKKSKKKKKKRSKKSDDEDDEEDSERSTLLENALPDDEDVKHIIDLPAFVINLADTEQARYLRMTVNLGVAEKPHEKEPDPLFMTRVKNAMLAILITKKSEDVLSVEGKSKLRKELLEAAQAASEEPEILAIYITDFIVQL